MENQYNVEYLETIQKRALQLKEKSFKLCGDSLTNKTIVDLGAGAGNELVSLSKLVTSKGKVYGLDHDKTSCKIAQEKCISAGCSNVEVICTKIDNLPFEDEAIDVVRAERVFQHLHNPTQVLTEIKRVLKPSGKVVILDTDWTSLQIYSDFIDFFKEITNFILSKRVNNPYVAKNTVSILDNLKYRNIVIDIQPVTFSGINSFEEIFMFSAIAKELVKQSIIEETELNVIKNKIFKDNDKNTLQGSLNMVFIHAEK